MCGIAGLLGPDARETDTVLVRRMLRRMTHRGPDDEGCVQRGPFTGGMRRLSILDPTPAGNQPMTSADGRFTIVHNGEIYNFLELAEELAAAGVRFTSGTDTEVIVEAYARWGLGCLERLNGIWAFAIWDGARRRLVLARDRFGVKPLFVSERAGTLAFASEIKALLTLPTVSREPDPAAIGPYLHTGAVDRDATTFFADVRRFPAAHALVIEPGARAWHRYWTPPPPSDDASLEPQPGDRDLVDDFRRRLFQAVRLQLRSDVPVGSCLSGGIDSSAIVCVAASLRDGLHQAPEARHRERETFPHLAFFAAFADQGIDERPYVDAVVARTGVELHTTTPDATRFLEAISDVLDAQDEPFGSLSIVAQYEVMRIAHAAGVKVLLDGQGADELLGGYLHYPALRLAGALRTGSARAVRGVARQLAAEPSAARATLGRAVLGARPTPARLVRGTLPAAWLGPEVRAKASRRHPATTRGTLLAARLLDDVVRDNLPALLRYEDRNSMIFGIEARVPYLDHAVVEASLRLPDRLRVAGPRARKVVLRRAMRGIVPERVLERTDKVAFQPPQDRWLREAAPGWGALAANAVAEQEGFLRPGTLGEALAAFAAGRLAGTTLWRALNLELWLRGTAGRGPAAG